LNYASRETITNTFQTLPLYLHLTQSSLISISIGDIAMDQESKELQHMNASNISSNPSNFQIPKHNEMSVVHITQFKIVNSQTQSQDAKDKLSFQFPCSIF
jgi:hypothetical protein